MSISFKNRLPRSKLTLEFHGGLYQATVTIDNTVTATYFGCTEDTFKTRYNGHQSNFRSKVKKTQHATTLSTYIHSVKAEGKTPVVTWTIEKTAGKYKNRKCDLCLTEKLVILLNKDPKCLNRRSELLGKCRHSNKHKLKTLKRSA